VTELYLDQVQRETLDSELRSVRVPERVRMDALLDPRTGGEAREQGTNIRRLERPTLERAEQFRAPPAQPQLPPMVQPPLDQGDRFGIETDGASPITLPVQDRDRPSRGIHVFRFERQRLADSEAAPVEDRDERTIPGAGS
jgi:hypothetical protein